MSLFGGGIVGSAEDAVPVAAGNWRSFPSFVWWVQPEDPDAWCIVGVENRDSDCLAQSNAQFIRDALAPWQVDNGDGWPNYHGPDGDDGSPDVSFERMGHWACGWTENVCVRVVGADGVITPAFRALWEIEQRLLNYPVLDEEDFSRREWEEGWEWAEIEGPSMFGRAWGVFITAGDVVRAAFDRGADITGDGWGRDGVWADAGAAMGVYLMEG